MNFQLRPIHCSLFLFAVCHIELNFTSGTTYTNNAVKTTSTESHSVKIFCTEYHSLEFQEYDTVSTTPVTQSTTPVTQSTTDSALMLINLHFPTFEYLLLHRMRAYALN